MWGRAVWPAVSRVKAGLAADDSNGRFLAVRRDAKHDVLGLAALVRSKEVTSEDILDAAIARVKAVNRKINAIVVKVYKQARQAVQQGLPKGPFTGVPFLVKDLGFWMMKGVECSRVRAFSKVIGRNVMTPSASSGIAGLVWSSSVARTHPEGGNAAVAERSSMVLQKEPLETGSDSWGFLRRISGSGGGRDRAHGQRKRRGRFDPHPRLLLRPIWLEANPGPCSTWPRGV